MGQCSSSHLAPGDEGKRQRDRPEKVNTGGKLGCAQLRQQTVSQIYGIEPPLECFKETDLAALEQRRMELEAELETIRQQLAGVERIQISLSVNGETIEQSVSISEKAVMLKLRLHEAPPPGLSHAVAPPAAAQLTFGGVEIGDNSAYSENDIEEGAQLSLAFEPSLSITIQNRERVNIAATVWPAERVDTMISRLMHIHGDRLRGIKALKLEGSDQVLDPSSAVKATGIQDGAVLVPFYTMPVIDGVVSWLDAASLLDSDEIDGERVNSWACCNEEGISVQQHGNRPKPQFNPSKWCINGIPAVHFAKGETLIAARPTRVRTIALVAQHHSAESCMMLFAQAPDQDFSLRLGDGRGGYRRGGDGNDFQHGKPNKLWLNGSNTAKTWPGGLDAPVVIVCEKRDGRADGDDFTYSLSSHFMNRGYDGLLGEVVVWDRALSEAECAEVREHLHTKWRVPAQQ